MGGTPVVWIVATIALGLPTVSGDPGAATQPIVHAPAGAFAGTAGAKIDTFKGIQYGTVPGRFERADMYTYSTGAVTNATVFGPQCYQPLTSGINITMDEECLYLNIYRPTKIAAGLGEDVHVRGFLADVSRAPSPSNNYC